MNCVMISGRLLRNPEITYHKRGNKKVCVAKFVLVSRKPNASSHNSVNYVFCEAVGKQAEFAQRNLKQGQSIGVVGYLDVYNFISKNGSRISKWRIIVEQIEYLEKKNVEKIKYQDSANASADDEWGDEEAVW